MHTCVYLSLSIYIYIYIYTVYIYIYIYRGASDDGSRLTGLRPLDACTSLQPTCDCSDPKGFVANFN